MSGEKQIAWLSTLSKADTALAGTKAADLGEMYNSKFPVPQAFTVTTEAFHSFLEQTKLKQKIKDTFNKIDENNTEDLQEKSKKIQNLIISAAMPTKLQSEILEAYDHFNVDLNEIQNAPGALAILKSAREPVFVSVRNSSTPEELSNTSFINIKGNPELLQKIKECFASVFTSESIHNQKKKGLTEIPEIAVIVQKMINSDKSGVVFSNNPKEEIIIKAVFGFGQGIDSKEINPDQYTLSKNFEILKEKITDKKLAIERTASGQTKTTTLDEEKSSKRVLKTHELKQLAEYASKLEEHYQSPQKIEFAIENNKIYILETQLITVSKEEIMQPPKELEEILPIIQTRIKIKTTIDAPDSTSKAVRTKASGIGLVKLEKLIAASGSHPLFYEQEKKLEDYKNIIKHGLEKIAHAFIGKPIWVRLSYMRSDKYQTLKGAPEIPEKNPSLGNHGIRFLLKHPEILKAELLACKELADQGHRLGIMLPQIISVEEIKQTKTIFNSLKITNIAFGVIIETPAASILIKDICETGIDFISFATDNLTQYTLATDKANKETESSYNETSWAILKQISRVTRECKKQGVETSIYGHATSNAEMIKFLIKQGIDSISVSPEYANEASKLIQQLEIDSQIEPIDNNEEIKKEIEERKQENEETAEEPKKEDIFN